MTTLVSSLSTDVKGQFASMQSRSYFTNDFDAIQVWNPPKATADTAGITGPAAAMGSPSSTAAGSCTTGTHLIRYRYKNSKTGYVSNPSDALTYTVTGAGAAQLTFNYGGPVTASADAKVDTIVVEMSPVNSPTYYVAATALNSASSVVVSISDSSLVQQANVSATTGDYGHEPPAIGAIMVPHRGRMFIFGATTRTRTSTTFTNSSTTVTGTNFSTKWAGRLIRAGSSAVAYEIASVTNSTTLVLTTAFAETTTTATASIFSKFPNRGKWSRVLYPEGFKDAEYARDFLQNRADQITAACSYGTDIYVFGSHSSERLTYNLDPAVGDGQVLPIPGDRGCFQQRCLAQADGEWYSWDRQGIYKVTANGPQHISGNIDITLLETVDYSQSDSFHACFEPIDRVLHFFHVRSGDSSPKYAACYEKDTGRWFFHRYLMGITGSGVVASSDGQVRMMIGDENGYTWFAGVSGSFDGVPPTSATVLTTTGTPTTTSIQVTDTLPTGTTTLAGVVVYDPNNGNTAVCSSNTADTLTTSAFASAPTGPEVWVGVIPFEVRTKWLTAPTLDNKKRPLYLSLKIIPGSSTGKLRVYYYLDFSTSPYVWTKPSGVTDPDSVTTVDGQNYAEVTLSTGTSKTDAQVSVPVPGDFWRALQIRFVNERPDGSLRIVSYDLIDGDGKPAYGE